MISHFFYKFLRNSKKQILLKSFEIITVIHFKLGLNIRKQSKRFKRGTKDVYCIPTNRHNPKDTVRNNSIRCCRKLHIGSDLLKENIPKQLDRNLLPNSRFSRNASDQFTANQPVIYSIRD